MNRFPALPFVSGSQSEAAEEGDAGVKGKGSPHAARQECFSSRKRSRGEMFTFEP